MRIGFTGSRAGMTEQQKQTLIQVLQEYWPVEFHPGDSVGADAEAHAIVQKYCTAASVVIHPPANPALRAFCQGDAEWVPRDYLARNPEIADFQACIATSVFMGRLWCDSLQSQSIPGGRSQWPSPWAPG